jgi:hypothetical protein
LFCGGGAGLGRGELGGGGCELALQFADAFFGCAGAVFGLGAGASAASQAVAADSADSAACAACADAVTTSREATALFT